MSGFWGELLSHSPGRQSRKSIGMAPESQQMLSGLEGAAEVTLGAARK